MVETVSIQVVIDPSGARSGGRVVNKTLDDFDRNAGRAQKSIDSIGGSFRNLKRIAAGGIAGFGAIQLARVADGYNLIEARLEGAIDKTTDLVEAQQDLFDTAQSTGSRLNDTIDVFQRLSFARADLKATDAELFRLTESVQKLGVLSGASDAALSAGLTQFGQAMSSGTVRAEEFNSLLENIPLVALEIANALGKSPGELRNMVIEGKLASKEVFDALLSRAEKIDEEFAKFPATIGVGFGQLRNSATRALDTLNDMTSATEGIAQLFSVSSQMIDALIQVDGAQKSVADDGDVMVEWARAVAEVMAFAVDAVRTGAFTIDQAFTVIGKTIGAGAAQLALVMKGEFREALAVGDLWLEDLQQINGELLNFNATLAQSTLDKVVADMEAAGINTSKFKNELQKIDLGGGQDEKLASKINDQIAALERKVAIQSEELRLGRELTALEEFRIDETLGEFDKFLPGQKQRVESLNRELSILQQLEELEEARADRAEDIEKFLSAGDSDKDSADKELAERLELINKAFSEGDFGAEDALEAKRRRDALLEEAHRLHKEEITRIDDEARQDELRKEEAAKEKRLEDLAEQTGLTKQTLQDLIDFEKATQQEKISTITSFGAEFLNLLGTQSKKAFKVAQAFAIGDAIVNAYGGANKALNSLPFPANVAAAALVLAKGVANVNAIRAAKPGGGSAGGGGGGGASAGSPGNFNEGRPLGDIIAESQGGGQNIDIVINGSQVSDDQVVELISRINEKVGDGVNLTASSVR